MADVYVTNTGSFLPNDPVDNDHIEAVLGITTPAAARTRRLILNATGITTRYFAINSTTFLPSHTNSQLTCNAIQSMGDLGRVDVLATGTGTPDQLIPSHGSMVHGELGWDALEVVSTAGTCVAGAAAFKYAFLVIQAGQAQRGVATGSERVSPQFLARPLPAESPSVGEVAKHRPKVAFEREFLRWMLSDGAGAVLLENAPRGELSLKVHWVELFSYAHQLPACMYAGAVKNDDGSLIGWADLNLNEVDVDSVFAIKQDVELLKEHMLRLTLVEPIKAIRSKHHLSVSDVDWFLPHMSSMFFADKVEQHLMEVGFPIPHERWFTNLTTCGNTGAGASYIILDELFHSGRLNKGDKLLVCIPESARFSCGMIYMEAV